MGRPRKHRRDLPECVYYKNGAYYFPAKRWWRVESVRVESGNVDAVLVKR